VEEKETVREDPGHIFKDNNEAKLGAFLVEKSYEETDSNEQNTIPISPRLVCSASSPQRLLEVFSI
jgi:hypothetical protein